MRTTSRSSIPLSLAFALLAPLALAAPARAGIVDPDRTTLAHLAAEADAVALVTAPEGGGPLVVGEVLRLNPGLPAPATASPSAGARRGAGGTGLAFLSRGRDGAWRVAGGERGLVLEDAAAVAFVRASLASKGGAQAGSLVRLLAGSVESASARVREDALRGLAETPADLASLEAAARDGVRRGAEAWLDGGALVSGDPAPAITVLSRLPSQAGLPGLRRAARVPRASRLAGEAIRLLPGGVPALLADLASKDAPSSEAASGLLRTLGHAGDRAATPALIGALGREETRAAAFAGLTSLGDPAAVEALRPYVLQSERMSPDLARAAVALAYIGGDAAIGALEFAEANHRDQAARAFVTDLRRSPAEVRARVEAGE